MNYKNLIKIALKALSNNKFRGFLTMLGIIIGVASVIAMLAIGQGSKRSIREQISEMGSNMIMVHPGAGRFGGVRQSASSMQTLKMEDYQTIIHEASYISACSPVVNSSGQVVNGANNAPTSVYGINQDYMEIRKYSVGEGEMFTDQDIRRAAKVCVVGKTVVENLFTNGEDPLGKTIRFGKIPFKIIGVLTPKGYNSMGQDQDDLILAPYTTVQKRILAITYLQGIFASAISEEMSGEGRRRFQHPFAGRTEFDVEFDDRPDDHPAGLYRGHIAVGRRDRDHEHHVRVGNRAYPGDRVADVDRSQRTAYPVAISD